MFFLVGVYDCSERIQQVIERMFFIDTDFINEFIEALYRLIVIILIANDEKWTYNLPMSLNVFGYHGFCGRRFRAWQVSR